MAAMEGKSQHMAYRNNSDRYGDQVARMRLRTHKPANTVQPTKPANLVQPEALELSSPIQPAQPVAQKSDSMCVLVECVKRHGNITMLPSELSTVLGLSTARDQAALLGVLGIERQSLFINGIRYFPHTGTRSHGAITFRMLELDSFSSRQEGGKS